MPAARVYFDLADTADGAFDAPVEGLLIAMLAFSPLAFGAVPPWAEAIFIMLAMAMALVLALKLLVRADIPFVRSWTYYPIAAFLLLILIQLLPLPATWVQLISPQTFATKTRLLSDLPDASSRLRWMTLTFYREATMHDLLLVSALAAVFVVVVNCIRRVSQIRRVLGAIAIIGAVVALIALAQDAMGTSARYGIFELPEPARSGPFRNHSHFGQFMNLSIGAAIGLVLVLVNQHFRRDRYSPRELGEKLRQPEMRPAWGALGMIVISLAAIVLSLSRGAMLSAAIAGIIVGIVVLTRRGMRARAWIGGAIGFFVLLIVLLDYDTVLHRVTEKLESQHGNRWEIARDISRAWKQFPVFGTGLGTHAAIFPMYDRSYVTQPATHAENEYVQLMTETGGVGVLLATVFLLCILIALVKAARGALSPASGAALGIWFGLIAILIHSFTDFGQHIPAVAVLTAVACGLALNLAELRGRELDRASTELTGRGSFWKRATALATLVVVTGWFAAESYSRARADLSWQIAKRIESDLKQKEWIAENAEFADIIDAAAVASSWRPNDVEYHCLLNLYRWKAITRVTDDEGVVVLNNDGRAHLARIISELHKGRALCPTYGRLSLLAGQLELEFFPDRKEAATRDIERGLELSGADADAAYIAGWVDAIDGNVPRSIERLTRAVRLDHTRLPDVLQIYVQDLNRPDMALEVAADDPAALQLLERALVDRPELAQQARARRYASAMARAQSPDASAEQLFHAAELLVGRNELESAIPYFRRGLIQDYGQIDQRYKLATTLEELGRDEEALREAQTCLLRRSQWPEARAMVERLKRRIDAKPKPTTRP